MWWMFFQRGSDVARPMNTGASGLRDGGVASDYGCAPVTGTGLTKLVPAPHKRSMRESKKVLSILFMLDPSMLTGLTSKQEGSLFQEGAATNNLS